MSFLQELIKRVEQIYSLYLITFLFVIGIAIYTNSLSGELFFDDEDFVYNNVYVQNFRIDKFFTENLIAGAGRLSNYYRPLLLITYATEHKFFGFHPFIYHLDNVIIHIASSILLFFLIRKVFSNQSIAFITSLLFLIHPLQTEAVAYVSGRGDPLSAFFIFSTILLFLQKERKWQYASLLTYIASILSRETAILTPFLIGIIFLFQNKYLKKTLTQAKQLIPMFIIGICYFLLRLTSLNFVNTLNFYDTATPYSQNIIFRLLTFFSILPEYIMLVIYPNVLNYERDPTVITTVTTYVFLSIVVLSSLFFIGIRKLKTFPILLFCLLWFFITISPTIGIIPINGIMYEHFLYLPSIGIFILAAYGITHFAPRLNRKLQLLFLLSFCTLLLFFIVRTVARNADWSDTIRFYTKTLELNPTSPRILNNLGMQYAKTGNHKEAIKLYERAIDLRTGHAETYYNLANSYVNIENLKNAETNYKKAIEVNPLFLRPYRSLLLLYKYQERKHDQETLIKQFEELVKKYPYLSDYFISLKRLN